MFNKIKKFIKDLFTESKDDNKFSSKKFMGIVVGLMAAISAQLDGLEFYNLNPNIIDSMWIYSGSMLGLSVARHFSKNPPKNEKD